MTTYAHKIGCNINNLRGVRDFIREILMKHGVPVLLVSEMVLALDEMISNLMIHAHHCNPDDLLEIHITIERNKPIVFEIIDEGSAFDINRFIEPSLNDLINEKRKGGLGIRLVKSIMDKVEYLKADGKNVCRLTKSVNL